MNPIGPQHTTWISIQTHLTGDMEHTGQESGLTPPEHPGKLNSQLHGEGFLRLLLHVLPGFSHEKMYDFTEAVVNIYGSGVMQIT